jgi:ferredoxin like protein
LMKRMGVEEKLGLNKFLLDEGNPHIKINKEICRACTGKPCLVACPDSLYTLKEEEIGFDYAGCLECGTCRIICPKPGAIDWSYPRGTFGVAYRYG